LDTRLKKTHKNKLHIIAVLIMAITILGSAVAVVSFYPQVEKAAIEKKDEYKYEQLNISPYFQRDIIRSLMNKFSKTADDAVYAGLCNEYFILLEDFYGEDVYEAINKLDKESKYYIEIEGQIYTNCQGALLTECQTRLPESKFHSYEFEQVLETSGIDNFFHIEFDENGMLNEIALVTLDGADYRYMPCNYIDTIIPEFYSNDDYKVEDSKYCNNGSYLYGAPRNCKAIYMIDSENQYVYTDERYSRYYDPQDIWVETGAFAIPLAFAVLVASVALILPLIKPLGTGKEKLFSMPIITEMIVFVIFTGVAAGMCAAMIFSRQDLIAEILADYGQEIKVIGYSISEEVLYKGILVCSVIGWAITFFLEYVLISALGQFITHPIKYIKEKSYTVRFIIWVVKKLKEVKTGLFDTDLKDDLRKKIRIVVFVNFAVISTFCLFWYVGIIAALIYSVALMMLFITLVRKMQNDYDKALNTLKEMGNGNLKTEIDKELGMFSEMGDELEKIQTGFRAAVVEEAKSQNMKTELITNVSHDLKTPLTAIITYVNLLKDENISEEERNQYIATLDMKSQRLKVLIDDLFEISKANSGNVSINPVDVDIVGLIKQVRLELEDKINDSSLIFRWNLPEEKVILQLDSQRTYRIFENLIINILKYSMENSRVYVDVEESADSVSIVMKNVSKTEMNYDAASLTERFVRGDLSRNSEGSGLGLAIVKSFVELQNGRFDIETDGDLFKAIIVWPK